MARLCKLRPEHGTQLFDSLKQRYDYGTAWRLWALSTLPDFLTGKNFRLDNEGFPLVQDLINDPEALEIMGEEKAVQGIERQFPVLPDTRDNYAELIQQTYKYNSSPDNRKYIAVVDYADDDSDNLKVRIQRRTLIAERRASEQYSTQVLNERLGNILSSIGISFGDITEAELKAGRVGVTDFIKAKELAHDCASVIRVANNREGYRALGEEFSHLIMSAYLNEPVMRRAMEVLQDEDILREILGDEFDADYAFYGDDWNTLAEEALGKLLREKLLAQISDNGSKVSFVMNKLYTAIRNKFKRLDASAIEDAIIAADGFMGQLAKDILTGQADLKRKNFLNNERDVQLNALSDRIKANVEILKKIRDVEVKRYKISRKASNEEIEKQKEKISKLSELTETEKSTRIGLYNYGIQAIEDLKEVEASLTQRTYTGTPSFGSLRRAKSYIQSYGGFIKDMRNAIIESKSDDEVPEFLTEIELPDGTVVSMSEMVKELDDLLSNLAAEYYRYAKSMLTDFFRPFYGNTRTLTAGSQKGKELSIEAVIAEASSDISFLDLFVDTMADSSDVLLQLFDAVAKQANDNARRQTIHDSNKITRLRLLAEEAGIRDYEWMFEKDSLGRKTGNYISEFNIGAYREAEQDFMESLDKRYGKHAKGEAARLKIKEKREWYDRFADTENPSLPKHIEKWQNKEYIAMLNNPAKRALYDGFMELKWQADNQYPDNRVSPFKAIQRRKSIGNRLIDSVAHPDRMLSNLKEAARQTFLDAEDDEQLFGNKKSSLTNFDGTEYMALPVLYTARLKNPDDLSTDIFSDLLVYKYSANVYEQMDKIVDPLEVAKDWASNERKVQQTRGVNPVVEKISALGEKITNNVYKGDSNIERKINAWMESRLYQRYMKDEGIIDIGIAKLNKGKIGNFILQASSLASLGFNFLANAANLATGLAMANIEAFAGQYFNARQLASADASFFSYLPSYMSELGSRNKTNFLSLFDEFFNIKADYGDKVKRNQKRNVFQKLFGSNMAFIGQDGGDFWLYNRIALAFCKNQQVLVPKTLKQAAKKVTDVAQAKAVVSKITENSNMMRLSEDEKSYIDTSNGRTSARVTSVISGSEENDAVSEAWKVPSTNIGTGIDELIRDFFSGLLLKTDDNNWHHNTYGDDLESVYPNISKEDMYAFLEQLSVLKNEFDQKGLTVIPRDVVARGKITVNNNGRIRNLSVSGTLDLLAYDQNGDFYIYDMKTHRGRIRNTTKYKWAMQLSLYKRFLEEEYGINVRGLNIIPVKVNYDAPEGTQSGGVSGHAVYSVEDNSHQLLQDGKVFKEAKPQLDSLIPLTEVKKIPVEYDNLGYNKQLSASVNTDDYEQMSLLEALRIENVYSDREDIKRMAVPDGTLTSDGTPISVDRISRQIQQICIHQFGAYNEEDSQMANRYVMGRALMQFRKWIKPQFNIRFQKAQLNVISDRTVEGYYRTFGKYYANKFFYNFMNEALRGKVQIAAHWNELTEDEKANIKRAWTEIIQYICIMLIASYAPWPDDKNRPWALKFAEYMAQREKHELGMLTPSVTQLQEISKTVKSPLSCMTTISNGINLVNSLLSPEDWIDEKKSGPYKGMSTLEANFLRAPLPLLPYYRQIEKFSGELDTSINYYARPGSY